ncbi:MAG: acyl carrier protein [Candidatus Cryptobacteroides sp.]
MRQHIYKLLSDALPAVDFDRDFLFGELDSLGIATIMMLLERDFKIRLKVEDATPRNLRNIDSIVKMVETKLAETNNQL